MMWAEREDMLQTHLLTLVLRGLLIKRRIFLLFLLYFCSLFLLLLTFFQWPRTYAYLSLASSSCREGERERLPWVPFGRRRLKLRRRQKSDPSFLLPLLFWHYHNTSVRSLSSSEIMGPSGQHVTSTLGAREEEGRKRRRLLAGWEELLEDRRRTRIRAALAYFYANE